MRRRWGTPEKFLLAFLDELWKTWKIKILKKKKKKSYTCVPKATIMRFLRYRVRIFFVILGHFLPFYLPPRNNPEQKTKIWKNEKSIWRCHHFELEQQKTNDDHMKNGFLDIEHDIQNFFSFRAIFCPFTPLTTQKSKLWKNEKKSWWHYHFKHEYHKWNKWKSYDVRFLRYEVH